MGWGGRLSKNCRTFDPKMGVSPLRGVFSFIGAVS